MAFDVYETLLFRVVGHHHAGHLLLGRVAGRRGLIAHDAIVIAAARHQAETRARRRAAGDEISLADIHEELADSFGYGSARQSEMLNLELETEARTTRTTELSKRLVADARRSGGRVVFISDMYLPETFVRSMLERHSLLLPNDGLYVSSAWNGATKRSRRLFQTVIDHESVRPAAITHTGNSWQTDVLAARRSGLVANHFAQGNLNRFEQALESWSRETAGLASMMAGASRLARFDQQPGDSPRTATLRRVAAGVVSPVVSGFVLWLLNRAQRDGVARLYFLAREGQILYEVAKQLCARTSLQIDLRYLYVSRQSLNVAAVVDWSDDELAWVLTHSASNSVRTILARLGNSPHVIAPMLESAGWSSDRWDTPIGTEELPRLLKTVTGPQARLTLKAGMAEARELAVGYLEQEGVFDPVSIGIVDSTGGGSQIRAIDRLRRERSLSAIRGYLMFRVASKHTPNNDKTTQISSWFGDEVRRRGYGPTPGRAALMEVVCAADHGTTLSYERVDGRVRHVLDESQEAAAVEWGLPVVRSTIARFVEELCLDPELVDLDPDIRPMISEVMAMLWNTPSRTEAEVWGGFPFQPTSGRGDTPAPLASAFSLGEVLAALARRELRDRTWFEWSAASEQLSSPPTASLIRSTRWTKHATRRWLGQAKTRWVSRERTVRR